MCDKTGILIQNDVDIRLFYKNPLIQIFDIKLSLYMMMSKHGHDFRNTGPLRGIHRLIVFTKID